VSATLPPRLKWHHPMWRAQWILVAVTASLMACGGSGGEGPSEPSPQPEVPVTDCVGSLRYANPTPGSSEWVARDEANQICARQRNADLLEQPESLFVPGRLPALDVYRTPTRHANVRFRFMQTTTPNRDGKPITVEIYRPCASGDCAALPAGLERRDGPYPTVVIVHGGSSSRRLHWSQAQTLAEAGYMTVSLDTTAAAGSHGPDTQDVIDWLFATPTKPLSNSSHFPYWQDLDTRMVGIAGHSQGASTASLIGQIDPRMKAIVAWDNLTSIRSRWVDQIGIAPPDGVTVRTPALGLGADYNFTPAAYEEMPEPAKTNTQGGRGRGAGPHPKDPGYQELRAAGVDTMLLVLRAATHLDFSLFGGPASRYGEATANYYTLAWFDRYLKGLHDPAMAQNAFARLVAPRFDSSVDRHNISQGFYDAEAAKAAGDVYAGNRPYRIDGMPTQDRLSFYFKSRCSLTTPQGNGRHASEDLRSLGCLQAR
jgi:hypothetical protein